MNVSRGDVVETGSGGARDRCSTTCVEAAFPGVTGFHLGRLARFYAEGNGSHRIPRTARPRPITQSHELTSISGERRRA
jgi:hypothetical protein